jgi:protein ImuB
MKRPFLALWCIRYSPLVTPDPPNGIFIDVAGSAHLFQGEPALLKDLCQRLSTQGVTARAAIADTPGCAWAVARYGGTAIVSPGRASEAVASLPVAALRLSDKLISSLHDVGIERVAQIASKPRAGLRLRFGGDVLLRFDQALGSAQEALASLIPPEVPRSELRFAEPVADPEDLKRIIERLCEKLCLDLEARGIGARRLDLIFVRVDNITQAARIGLSRPYRGPKHLSRLLADRLVVIDPGFGIELASLTASWVEALAERQTVGRHVAEDGSDVMSASSSIRLACGWDRKMCSVWRRWKAPCPSGRCAASPLSIRRRVSTGPNTCRARPVFLPARKKWKPLPSCRIIRRASSFGATPVTGSQEPMVQSESMATGG